MGDTDSSSTESMNIDESTNRLDNATYKVSVYTAPAASVHDETSIADTASASRSALDDTFDVTRRGSDNDAEIAEE